VFAGTTTLRLAGRADKQLARGRLLLRLGVVLFFNVTEQKGGGGRSDGGVETGRGGPIGCR